MKLPLLIHSTLADAKATNDQVVVTLESGISFSGEVLELDIEEGQEGNGALVMGDGVHIHVLKWPEIAAVTTPAEAGSGSYSAVVQRVGEWAQKKFEEHPTDEWRELLRLLTIEE